MTWQDLTKLEPRLGHLLAKAKAIRADDPHFCANAVWYGPGGLRSELRRLVGWHAEQGHSLLRSEQSYDLAYRKVYYALPNCRECGC